MPEKSRRGHPDYPTLKNEYGLHYFYQYIIMVLNNNLRF